MGAVQSDLKASIVQATSGLKAISPKSDEYWQIYWTRPETAEHVFETFTATDIRGMRDTPIAVDNLKTLILKTTFQILKVKNHAYSLSEENSRHGLVILNCVRLLTRVLPYVYESDETRAWDENVLSGSHDPSFYREYCTDAADFVNQEQTITSQLIQTLLDLLFYTGFTLPWPESDQQARRGQVTYSLWQSGIACDTTVISTKEHESRRTEILRLLLTLESKSIYVPPNTYIDYDVEAVRCIATHTDKRRLQSLLCSLLNTIVKHHPGSWPGLDSFAQSDSNKDVHIRTCLHFLIVNMLNRAPWDEGRDRNEFRLQFSYLHKPKHLQFLTDGIFTPLKRPMEPASSVLSMGSRVVPWIPEFLIFLWEALYSSRKFLHYMVESRRALDLVVCLTYYAKQSQMDGIGRVCVFCLQTLSAEQRFGESLNRPFDSHDALPSDIQIKNFHGTYADFFITSMLSMLEQTPQEAHFWSASIASTIQNVAPHITSIGRATSAKLLQTFARLSKANVVLANEMNVNTLASLLRAINVMIENHDQHQANANLLYAVWRAKQRFRSLRDLSLMDEDSLSEVDPHSSRRSSLDSANDVSETERSKGKRPSDHKFSSSELMVKLAGLPLHTPLTLIALIESNVVTCPEVDGVHRTPPSVESAQPSVGEIPRHSTDKANVFSAVQRLGPIPGLESQKPVSEKFVFQPSIAALYASYYWGLVVSHDAQRVPGKGMCVWAVTDIRLFRTKAGQVQGPSLWSPKGAVDAVGETLVAGVKDLTMRAKRGIRGE